MIKDIFVEHIVKKKKDRKEILIIVGIFMAGVFAIDLIFILSMFFSLVRTLLLFLIALVCLGVYFLLSRRNLEFEYSVTNGEIDIDCIIARRKRKRLLSVRVRDIVCCASIYDKDHASDHANKEYTASVIMAASSMTAPGTYFADLVTREGLKARLYFEPTPPMLEAFLQYNPRNVHVMEE